MSVPFTTLALAMVAMTSASPSVPSPASGQPSVSGPSSYGMDVRATSGRTVSPRGTVNAAVATNFADAHERLVAAFEAGTGHEVITSLGSTGQLYAQIRNGAPYDIFLAADRERPELLEQAGESIESSRFTYALGRLVLYGSGLDSVRSMGVDLENPAIRRVAIANPKLAPYGRAAEQALVRLGLREAVSGRLVQGENVAQTFQFVSTGAAELGFVAWSQVQDQSARLFWLVPEALHDPIAQDAILLRRARTNPAAFSYLEFLRGAVARRIIESFGYGVVR